MSQRGVSIEPAELGDMTVSMLRGEAGNQRKEIEKLVDWLITDVRPDVVHLSNSMHDRHGADAQSSTAARR